MIFEYSNYRLNIKQGSFISLEGLIEHYDDQVSQNISNPSLL